MLNINSKIKCKHVFLKHPPKPPSKGESIKHTANLMLLVQPLINFLTKLTFKRLINLIKNHASFWLSSCLGKPVVWGMPYSYSIESASICNLSCPECPTGKGQTVRKNKEISLKLFQTGIEQIAEKAIYLLLYLQGEPYLNRNIFEMIRLAKGKGLYTCLSTNGHFMDQENAYQTVTSGLNRIIISVDGTTNDVYRQYRQGGNLETVLEGIKNLVEAKKSISSNSPYIILQFIVFKQNQHQINEFKNLGHSIGANKTEFKSAQLYDFKNGHPMMTDVEKFSRYQKSGNQYILKKPLRNLCKRIWTTGVLTSDGILIPCCYDKAATYPMGNTGTENLNQLWKGKAFMDFRKKILENRKQFDICCNCDE